MALYRNPQQTWQRAEFERGLVLFGKWVYKSDYNGNATTHSAARLWFYSTGGRCIWKLLPDAKKSWLMATWSAQIVDLRNEAGARLALENVLQHFRSLDPEHEQEWKQANCQGSASMSSHQSMADLRGEMIVSQIFELLLKNPRSGINDGDSIFSVETAQLIRSLCENAETPAYYVAELFCTMRISGIQLPSPLSPGWSNILAFLDEQLFEGGFVEQKASMAKHQNLYRNSGIPQSSGSADGSSMEEMAHNHKQQAPRLMNQATVRTPGQPPVQMGLSVSSNNNVAINTSQASNPSSTIPSTIAPTVAPILAPQTTRMAGCGPNTHLYPTLQAALASYQTRTTKTFDIPQNDDDVAAVKQDVYRHVNELYAAIVQDPVCITPAQTSGARLYSAYLVNKLKDGADVRHQRLAWRIFDAVVQLHEHGTHDLEDDEMIVHTNGKNEDPLREQDKGLKLLARLQAVKDACRQYKLIVKDCGSNDRGICFLAYQPFMEQALKEQSNRSNAGR